MAKSYIHVNQHNIKFNRANGDSLPVITVKTGTKNRYGHEAVLDGPVRVVYRPEKPLKCGARVWIECLGPVKVVNHTGRPAKIADAKATPQSESPEAPSGRRRAGAGAGRRGKAAARGGARKAA